MSRSEGPVAITPDGQLRGATEENIDGQTFLKFLGIRYGKPPVANLRFQPPEPVDPWEGVKEATKVGNSSIAIEEMSFQIDGDEDCLYLNVYTRQLPGKCSKLRPVLFYIHGGGFVWGSSRPGIHGPKFLMTKDVVLVTINYRLGILGFLSVDGTNVTGNMGLKDQNLALKWVQRNIASFNGDPNNVTIFGESAGAAAVHLHILSPVSKALFHKAILQSGTALNFWCWGSKNNARLIVELLGKNAKTEAEALEILKHTPALEIYNAQERLNDFEQSNVRRPIGPVLESPGKSAFLTENPRDAIKNGTYNKVPMILGYNDKEGYILDFMLALRKKERKPLELEKVLPFELNFKPGSDDLKKVVALMKSHYTENSLDDYDIITDSWFLSGIIQAAEKHLETSKSPIYLYRMSICSNLNYCKAKNRPLTDPGVSHADDLGYLWHMEVTPQLEPGSLEDRYMRIFVDLWTQFAEFGNPTPDVSLGVSWTPLESNKELEVMDIGEPLQVKPIPEADRVNLWRQIYKTGLS